MAQRKKSARKPTTSRAVKKTKTSIDTMPEPVASEQTHTAAPNIVRSKKFIIPVVILVILGVLYLFKGTFIAATVNGQPVSRLAVIHELERQSGKQALDNLITKQLILQEGSKKNITVSQKDLDGQIKEIESNLKQQGMTIDQALEAQGMTRAALTEELRVQLIVQKLVGTDVKVSDEDVQEYVEQNQEFLEATSQDGEINQDQVREQLKQQKLQQATQEYIANLRKNAQINYFTSY